MEIKIKQHTDEDYKVSVKFEIDGKPALDFWDGCPEDNCIYRNFNDVFKIKDILKLAYNAGKNGEVLEFIDEELKEEE